MSGLARSLSRLMSLLTLTGIVLSACQPPGDLLGEIKKRGVMRVSTDPNYAPQSEQIPDARRAADTQCASDELTANQLRGFDIDVAVEMAKRLAIEPCFVTPTWETIVAGDWGGRWDISVGSMTITKNRQKALYFAPAYYFTPAQLAARKGSGIASLADIAGKPVCVGTGTTYETYLHGGDVGIPPSDIKTPPPANVTVIPHKTDAECAQAIKAGPTDFDAFLTASPVIDQAIEEGIPVEKIGGPVYVENLAVAIDRKAPLDPRSLLDAITKIVNEMHSDGTLSAASLKWFGVDRTVVP